MQNLLGRDRRVHRFATTQRKRTAGPSVPTLRNDLR